MSAGESIAPCSVKKKISKRKNKTPKWAQKLNLRILGEFLYQIFPSILSDKGNLNGLVQRSKKLKGYQLFNFIIKIVSSYLSKFCFGLFSSETELHMYFEESLIMWTKTVKLDFQCTLSRFKGPLVCKNASDFLVNMGICLWIWLIRKFLLFSD